MGKAAASFLNIAREMTDRIRDNRAGDWWDGVTQLAITLESHRIALGIGQGVAFGIAHRTFHGVCMARDDEYLLRPEDAQDWWRFAEEYNDSFWVEVRPLDGVDHISDVWLMSFDPLTDELRIVRLHSWSEPPVGAECIWRVAYTREESADLAISYLNQWVRRVAGLNGAGNQAAPALEETADGPPQATATNVEKWREVMDSLEQCRLNGERFTSQRKFAERFKCSTPTVNKAIKRGSVELQEWAAKQRGESRLNAAPEVSAATFASTPQARESDPSEIIEADDVDAVMVYLIEQAEKSGPEAVARLQNMTPAERRQLAETAFHDPDLEEQVLRYRRKPKRRD